jgi:hypothetical protein
MALPASGAITFGNINTELGLTSTAAISLGSTTVRSLYGIASGAIRLAADGYGKSNIFGVATANDPIIYNFTNTSDSFTAAGATITTSASFMSLQSSGSDPVLRRTVSFSGKQYPYLQVNILRTRGSQWDGKVYYTTAGHIESASFYANITEPTWDGVNYQLITVDMRTLAAGGTDWTDNTITGIRFDFGANANDDFNIDFIVARGTIYPVAGLYGSQYTGYFFDTPSFFSVGGTGIGATNAIAYSSIATTTSYQWLGYFKAPSSGAFTFGIASDDSGYLWVGANAISGYTTANANCFSTYNTGAVYTGSIYLTAGTYYPIRFQHGNNGGAGNAYLAWTGPGQTATNDGTGEYFYNADTNGL